MIAGVLAAGAAYVVNLVASRFVGRYSVVFVAPLVEEFLKTYLAVFLRGDIVLSHTAFGVAEGVWDYFNAGKKANARSAALSVITHGLLGYGTFKACAYVDIIYAVALAALMHSVWNIIMMGGKRLVD